MTETEKARLRVMLVDDHEVVRAGLRTVLEVEPDIEVVAEADNASHAVVTAGRVRPELILMDVQLPDGSGIEACREIRAAQPSCKVLMLTSFGDEAAVLSSLMAGAAGYLLKNARRQDLLRAIRAVAEGATRT